MTELEKPFGTKRFARSDVKSTSPDFLQVSKMPSATLGELFSHPGFLWLSLTIVATVVNIVIGINIHPQNKKHKELHRYMYYVVMAGYLLFLAVTYSLHEDTWLEYSVFLYLLVAIPWTRGINVTLHAVLSSVGLSLLVLVAALALF